MSQTLQSSQHGPFPRLVNASVGAFAQPKGTVPRASNLIGIERGALCTSDGSQVLDWYNGAIQTNRGRFECVKLFSPIGVSPYFLALAKALDLHLGPPKNLAAADGGAGGTLGGTYFYKVTALDGVGGETTESNEVSQAVAASHKINLSWNVVPNAQSYNVYRSTTTNTENLVQSGIAQPSPTTATVSVTDPGWGVAGSFDVATATAALGDTFFYYTTVLANTFQAGQTFTASGISDSIFNITAQVFAVLNNTTFIVLAIYSGAHSGTGGTVTFGSGGGGATPPVSDNTQQVALFVFPISTSPPVSYSNSQLQGLFPASPSAFEGKFTPSGGQLGNTSIIPQMEQFTNRMVLALGNGLAPQLYYDYTGTTVNIAPSDVITSISVDAFGVVTVNVTGIATSVGSNMSILNVATTAYNGIFVVTSVASGTQFTVRNLAAIGSGADSTGIVVNRTSPISNTFVPAYPKWVASSTYSVGSIVEPTSGTGNFFKAVQGGASGSVEPTWASAASLGQEIADGTGNLIIWQNQGPILGSAPAPPGAAHIAVYSGCLWVLNTSPTNTANGLDGPTIIGQSDPNNPTSWNPINRAFLDKDDGSEGMGLGVFTISAEGIPPQNTLIAFKNYASYQVIGIFGSSNFAIQRIKTERGCNAPRTIQFVPGFGIGRMTHLGISIVDGVNDRLISEEVRPYLFPVNDTTVSDIVVADPIWISVSVCALTANPPMYCVFIPIGNSNGALTRALAYDLVLKGWAPIDFPFSISAATQALTVSTNPTTVLGGFADGLLQRWQAGDRHWLTGAVNEDEVAWSYRTPPTASQHPDQRLFCSRIVLKGIGTHDLGPVTFTPTVDGVTQASTIATPSPTGDFYLVGPVEMTGNRFYADISGTGGVEIDSDNFLVSPKPVGQGLVIA